MRPLLRHFLLLLIAVALPLSAWANVVGNAQPPCPMMAGEGVSMQAMKAKMDCCADAADLAKTGSPCKTGQECKTGSLGQITKVAVFTSVQNDSPLVGHQANRLPAAEPSGVWRPPRQI
ncbi:hypothetical protein [Chitinimonas naiadis]